MIICGGCLKHEVRTANFGLRRDVYVLVIKDLRSLRSDTSYLIKLNV